MVRAFVLRTVMCVRMLVCVMACVACCMCAVACVCNAFRSLCDVVAFVVALI